MEGREKKIVSSHSKKIEMEVKSVRWAQCAVFPTSNHKKPSFGAKKRKKRKRVGGARGREAFPSLTHLTHPNTPQFISAKSPNTPEGAPRHLRYGGAPRHPSDSQSRTLHILISLRYYQYLQAKPPTTPAGPALSLFSIRTARSKARRR